MASHFCDAQGNESVVALLETREPAQTIVMTGPIRTILAILTYLLRFYMSEPFFLSPHYRVANRALTF